MAKKKAGRTPTSRGLQGHSALVKFDRDEYELIERAIAIQTAGVVGGKAVTVAAFAKHASIGVAQRIVDDAEAEKLSQN